MSISNDDEQRRLEIELGEVDDVRFRFRRRAAAWTTYLQVAANVEPEVITSLVTPEALVLLKVSREEPQHLDRYVASWCDRWKFSQHYAHIPAQNTLVEASISGTSMPTTFATDVHGNWPVGDSRRLVITRASVSSDGGVTWREDFPRVLLPTKLPPFYWDPTRETKSHALKRIKKMIEEVVRSDLDAIEAAYLADDHEKVSKKRQSEHFIWLARRLLRKESAADIAKEVKPDQTPEDGERTIRRGTDSAAKELGLTPPRDRPGPKPKTG